MRRSLEAGWCVLAVTSPHNTHTASSPCSIAIDRERLSKEEEPSHADGTRQCEMRCERRGRLQLLVMGCCGLPRWSAAADAHVTVAGDAVAVSACMCLIV